MQSISEKYSEKLPAGSFRYQKKFDPAKEPEAAAAIDNLSASARLRVRRVYGSQDSAFAMALPLGLIPTKHVQVPSTIRDRL